MPKFLPSSFNIRHSMFGIFLWKTVTDDNNPGERRAAIAALPGIFQGTEIFE